MRRNNYSNNVPSINRLDIEMSCPVSDKKIVMDIMPGLRHLFCALLNV